ncbi:MAG: diguanylate cyclase [Gammaproteobacteria bacterium]|nr:diguanylate cyclase [Gammaproteobacteria bacterium]
MRQIFSLKFILPLVMLLLTSLVLAAFYVRSNGVMADIVAERMRVQHENTMRFLQRQTQAGTDAGNIGELKKLAASFVENDVASWLVVVDGRGEVLVDSIDADQKAQRSSNSSWDAALAAKAAADDSIIVRIADDVAWVDGYASLCSSTSIFLAGECGFVFYRMNINGFLDVGMGALRKLLFEEVVTLFLAGVALLMVIHFLITRRVRSLIDVMTQFTYGDRSIRTKCWGKDELRNLGESINGMLDVIVREEQFGVERQRRLDALFDTITDAVVVANHEGTIVQINPAMVKMFGYDAAELIGENVSVLMADKYVNAHVEKMKKYVDGLEDVSISAGRRSTGKRKDGEEFSVEISVGEMKIKNNPMFIGLIRDVTDRKFLEDALIMANEALLSANERLDGLATTDGLTGLANRRQFDELLEEEIRRNARKAMPISVLLCDVDYFKNYNDFYGHQAGDHCLVAVAEVMRNAFKRAGELPARYGGEEFAVILPGEDSAGAERIAEHLIEEIHKRAIPHEKSSVSPMVTLSVGLATAYFNGEQDIISPEALLKKADEGLYVAKQQGRNRVIVGGTVKSKAA